MEMLSLLRQNSLMSLDCLESSTSGLSGSSSKFKNVRAKLPKLGLKKFSGHLIDWPEFWDAFKSSVHENEEISEVDKFSNLKHYLQESAKKVISGFSLTELNYGRALDLLKTRFAKLTAIRRPISMSL